MRLLTGLRWNRPTQWLRKIRSTTKCSDLSVRGSHQRDRGALRKISRMAMTVSKEPSINGLRQRDIEKISCFPTLLASASPAQQALFLIAPIGQWRSRANISRCRQLQARERRLQQNENCLYNLPDREFSVPGLIRRDGGNPSPPPTMTALINLPHPPQT